MRRIIIYHGDLSRRLRGGYSVRRGVDTVSAYNDEWFMKTNMIIISRNLSAKDDTALLRSSGDARVCPSSRVSAYERARCRKFYIFVEDVFETDRKSTARRWFSPSARPEGNARYTGRGYLKNNRSSWAKRSRAYVRTWSQMVLSGAAITTV